MRPFYLDDALEESDWGEQESVVLFFQILGNPVRPGGGVEVLRMATVEREETCVCFLDDVDRRSGLISSERNIRDDLVEVLREDLGSNIGDSRDRQTAVDLGHVSHIWSDGVKCDVQEIRIRVLIEHNACRYVACALLWELDVIDQIYSLLKSKIHLVSQHVDINELPHILLPVVAWKPSIRELLPDFAELTRDKLLFRWLVLTVPNVPYEHRKTSHNPWHLYNY